ncbi:hypothetical protein [Variovorax sp. JS1663]|uniref:hypothetical protein n=1 Tax=Variovorax sp. JS1663 TaxID=1851577 RepID=UPI000B344B4E|nr:hypothetical protein [Variovorax sp. JS1663]OUM02725.1 hypothetical protein A8M77_08945 [Variovorax sp. JS1663]
MSAKPTDAPASPNSFRIAGTFGSKTGRSFYAYDNGARVEPPESVPTESDERAVWIADHGGDGQRVRDWLTGLGIAVDSAATPEAKRLISQ